MEISERSCMDTRWVTVAIIHPCTADSMYPITYSVTRSIPIEDTRSRSMDGFTRLPTESGRRSNASIAASVSSMSVPVKISSISIWSLPGITVYSASFTESGSFPIAAAASAVSPPAFCMPFISSSACSWSSLLITVPFTSSSPFGIWLSISMFAAMLPITCSIFADTLSDTAPASFSSFSVSGAIPAVTQSVISES